MSSRQSHLRLRYAGSCRAKLTGYAFLGHNFAKGQGTGEERREGKGDRDRYQQLRQVAGVVSRSRPRLQVSKHRSVSDGIRASKRRADRQTGRTEGWILNKRD